MTISNDHELREAATEASRLIQEIHDYCRTNGKTIAEVPDAQVRFPRGFIRSAGYQRSRFPFLTDPDLKSNIAYTLILSDTTLWLAIRTDLAGTAKDMLLKLFIFLVGTIVESTTKEYLKGRCDRNFKGRNEFMKTEGIISEELQRDLDWLWDTRNRMHLFQLKEREWVNDYDMENHKRTIVAFRGLLAALTKDYRGRTA